MSKIMREVYAEAARARKANDLGRPRRRYSTDDADAEGYANYRSARAAGKVCAVYCDGKHLSDVVTADEQQGVAICCVRPHVVRPDMTLAKFKVRGSILVELV